MYAFCIYARVCTTYIHSLNSLSKKKKMFFFLCANFRNYRTDLENSFTVFHRYVYNVPEQYTVHTPLSLVRSTMNGNICREFHTCQRRQTVRNYLHAFKQLMITTYFDSCSQVQHISSMPNEILSSRTKRPVLILTCICFFQINNIHYKM